MYMRYAVISMQFLWLIIGGMHSYAAVCTKEQASQADLSEYPQDVMFLQSFYTAKAGVWHQMFYPHDQNYQKSSHNVKGFTLTSDSFAAAHHDRFGDRQQQQGVHRMLTHPPTPAGKGHNTKGDA